MRKILFRGKQLYDGEWVHGFLTVDDSETPNQFVIDYLMPHKSCYGQTEIDPETVGQHTGLLDKNGKKIFEGDTVKATDRFDKSIDYFVEFKNGAFMLKQKGVNYHIYFNDLPEKYYRLEVIGNIHDNPELMRVQS